MTDEALHEKRHPSFPASAVAPGSRLDLLAVATNLIENTPLGITAYDDNGQCVLANEAAAGIVGATVEQLLTQNFHRIDSWRKSGLYDAAFKAVSGGGVRRIEVEIISTFGKPLWLDCRLVGFDSNDRVFLMLLIDDVTQERRVKAELKRSNADLEAFAYAVSHDLQEPLRTVAGFSELFEERLGKNLDEKARKYLGHMVGGVGRMQSLIGSLLEFSRVTTKARPLATTEVRQAVDDAIANLAASIRSCQATILIEELPAIDMDYRQIVQVFQNLVGNALKFRGESRPKIRISCHKLLDHCQFTVADNGIGIDPAHHHRVFQVFARLHGRDAYEGTGIGLAICKRIVERHNGTIWVESTSGSGARFHFTLPCSHQTPVEGTR